MKSKPAKIGTKFLSPTLAQLLTNLNNTNQLSLAISYLNGIPSTFPFYPRTKLALTAIRACSVIENGTMADYILPSLIKVTEKTNKVMVNAAHDMALITARKCQHIPHPFLSEQLKNPSKTARFTVFSCFIVVSAQLDVPTLEKTIKSAILDSSGQIRDCARTLFATYQELHSQSVQK